MSENFGGEAIACTCQELNPDSPVISLVKTVTALSSSVTVKSIQNLQYTADYKDQISPFVLNATRQPTFSVCLKIGFQSGYMYFETKRNTRDNVGVTTSALA